MDMLDTPTVGIKELDRGEVHKQQLGVEPGIKRVHMDLMDMVSYLHGRAATRP